MNAGVLDVEALVRACVLSMGCGLVVGTIGYFFMRPRVDWRQWKPVLAMGVIGMILVVAVFTYYAWPSTVTVPALDRLARAEAEELLLRTKLVPDARPQVAAGVEEGRVIPQSQRPNAGLRVRPGTMVTFGVSVSSSESGQQLGSPAGVPTAVLFDPKSGEAMYCARGGDALYRCAVRGTSTGLSVPGFGLLLWVKPVNPPSDEPGWYLERPPGNGIGGVDGKGSWSGVVQIGNRQYPPHEGDVVDLAVSVVDDVTSNRLMAEPGVVVRDRPAGIYVDIASGVVITLKRKSG